ncbi:MAG: transcription termination factor NusA [Bifidobacteriaceae bacterium]|jgi:N utilization substance protein A|nr:transcription termination factor NusA [Bifidobacteriaceae bacterium]
MRIDMQALKSLVLDSGLDLVFVTKGIERALLAAYEKNHPEIQARVVFNTKTGDASVMAKNSETGQEYDDTPVDFARVATQSARRVIETALRDAKEGYFIDEFKSKKGKIISGIILQSEDQDNIKLDIGYGKYEAILPLSEKMPGEVYKHGSRIRVFVLDVFRGVKGPIIQVSRSHPGLVKALFELEVPEMQDGKVEIVSVSREAGHRSKIAVFSKDKAVRAVGSAIGPMGSRVRSVMNELGGEKIDIIEYSVDPAEFIKNALSPARASKVEVVSEVAKEAKVWVPEYQLSLAIGAYGQNARLAARLTGWKIDIIADEKADEKGE